MPKEIVTVTDAVKTTVPIVARPKQVNLYDVKVHVVNKDNYEEFLNRRRRCCCARSWRRHGRNPIGARARA